MNHLRTVEAPDYRKGMYWRAGAIASALLILAACGGGGGGSSGPGPSNVFAADEVNGGIGSSSNANPAPGTTTVDRIISGPSTGLPPGITMTTSNCFDCLRSLALDAQRDHLYVSVADDSARSVTAKVLVFQNAGTADGDIAPSRRIALAADQKYVQLDTQRDVLYISTRAGDILAVQGASTADTSSGPAPTFSTLSLGATDILGIALDPGRDVLYVLRSGSVSAINGVSARTTGSVTPDAVWGVASPAAFTIDPSKDRLFVSVSDPPTHQAPIQVYDGASTRTTAASGVVSRTFSLPSGFSSYPAIFVEPSADRIYAVGQNKIFIANGAGSASGAIPATLAQLFPMNIGLNAIVVRP